MKSTLNQINNFEMIIKKKKGVSIMIGYVLLIAIAIGIAVFVYNFLSTYVPQETISCPDTSLLIEDYSCNSNQLNITIRNNGNFDIGGFFIYDNSERNLYEFLDSSSSENMVEGREFVKFGSVEIEESNLNELHVGSDSRNATFEISGLTSKPNLIELNPIRYQMDDGRIRIAVCGDAITKYEISCDA